MGISGEWSALLAAVDNVRAALRSIDEETWLRVTFLLAAFSVLAWWIWLALRRVHKPRFLTWRRAKKMKDKSDRAKENALVSDLITHIFEDAEVRGLWTRKRKRFWYERIGRQCQLHDLIPHKIVIHPDAMKAHLGKLKESLKARRGVKEKKVKLPGDDNVVVLKPKETPAQSTRAALAKLATRKQT